MNVHSPDKKQVVRKLRCAVYTRKSSEEGLDMEFNSLDSERPVRLTSPDSGLRDGFWCLIGMTMAASPAPPWNAPA